MTKRQRLLQEAAAAAKSAREIAEKASAAGRDMTDDEHGEFQSKAQQAVDLKTQADAAKADEELLAKAADIAALIGPEAEADVRAQAKDPERKPAGKSLGQLVTESPEFKAALAPFAGRAVPEKSRIQSDPIQVPTLLGQKSLFIGGSATSAGSFVVPDRTDIVEMLGRRPLTVRDLISVRRTTSDTVEYVVQTSHTNAAAMVPEAQSTAVIGDGTGGTTTTVLGGVKPEGAWAFARRTANVKTLAEWVPATKRSLADVAALEGLINDELLLDLEETEENQVLNGNGTGENLPGILGTSGIQTQAAVTTTDATWLFSFRQAITKARTVGRVAPSAIVVNPVQAEKLDGTRDTQGRFYGNGPYGIGPRTLWGVPVVESEAIPAGTALLGDFSKAVLWDREQSSVTMTDSHADFFIRNLVAILAEERVAFAVTRPTAFVTVTGL